MSKFVIDREGYRKRYIKSLDRTVQLLTLTEDPADAMDSNEGVFLDRIQCENIRHIFRDKIPDIEFLTVEYDDHEKETLGEAIT